MRNLANSSSYVASLLVLFQYKPNYSQSLEFYPLLHMEEIIATSVTPLWKEYQLGYVTLL